MFCPRLRSRVSAQSSARRALVSCRRLRRVFRRIRANFAHALRIDAPAESPAAQPQVAQTENAMDSPTPVQQPRTLFDKLWHSHVVDRTDDGETLLYVDRHLVYEVTSPQAFEGLRLAGRQPWRRETVIATADHNVPTTPPSAPASTASPIRCRACRCASSTPTAASSASPQFGTRRPAPGHHPRRRPGAGRHAARHDGGGRRFAHQHARRLRARWPSASAPRTSSMCSPPSAWCCGRCRRMLVQVDGALPAGVTAKDLILAHHRPHRHRRRAPAARSSSPAARSARCRWKAA